MFGDINMFIGSYWSARRESRASAAARITRFLSTIEQYNHFSKWLNPSHKNKTAITINAETIERKFERNRTDVGGKVIPELGYDLTLCNGESESNEILLTAHLGSYSPRDTNTIILRFNKAPEITEDVCHTILQAMIREFEPDHAVVSSHSYLAKAGASKPYDAGWFIYKKDT